MRVRKNVNHVYKLDQSNDHSMDQDSNGFNISSIGFRARNASQLPILNYKNGNFFQATSMALNPKSNVKIPKVSYMQKTDQSQFETI